MSDDDVAAVDRAFKKFGQEYQKLCDLIVSTFKKVPMQEIVDAIAPSPPPTPNLSILRRFAKVAGWSVEELNDPPTCRFKRDVSPRIGSVPMILDIYSEQGAKEWLDSPEALDAAAIVAVRRGGGLSVNTDDLREGLNITVRVYGFEGVSMGARPRILSETHARDLSSRAAVLACLKAFEEKN